MSKALQEILSGVLRRCLDEGFEDWRRLTGDDARIEGVDLRPGTDPGPPEAWSIDRRLLGSPHPTSRLVFPKPLALGFVASAIGLPDSRLREKVAEPPSPEDLRAFREFANILCGSSNRVCEERGATARYSQQVDEIQVRGTTGDLPTLPGAEPGWTAVVAIRQRGASHTLLELIPEASMARLLTAAEQEQSAEAATPSMGRSVLVADGDGRVRILLARVLSKLGYRTLEAPDGVEAVVTALRERPDLIVMNPGLKRVGGEDVLRILEALPETAQVPVLLLPADDGPRQRPTRQP